MRFGSMVQTLHSKVVKCLYCSAIYLVGRIQRGYNVWKSGDCTRSHKPKCFVDLPQDRIDFDVWAR